MQKINYGRILDEKLKEIEKSGKKSDLLLHACCAPCSSHTILYLYDYFNITLQHPRKNMNTAKMNLKDLYLK